MFGIRFASVVVVCGFCLVLAGCGPDDDPLDPPKTSIDTTTSSSTSTSSTSSTIFEGITSPGVPAEFRFTVEGWTYEVSVDRIGRLTAEATVDPNSPPNIGALSVYKSGGLDGTVTSTDTGRKVMAGAAETLKRYKGYSGPIATANGLGERPVCDNEFDPLRTGMGGAVSPGFKPESKFDTSELYCQNIGVISSDPDFFEPAVPHSTSEGTAAPGDDLFDPASDAAVVAQFINDAPDPEVFLDVYNTTPDTCRFLVSASGVSKFAGPCEIAA